MSDEGERNVGDVCVNDVGAPGTWQKTPDGWVCVADDRDQYGDPIEGIQQEPEAVAEVIAEPVSDPVETAIGKWINGHLANSPLARATEAWNHVMGSLNALRTYLKEELGKGPPPSA